MPKFSQLPPPRGRPLVLKQAMGNPRLVRVGATLWKFSGSPEVASRNRLQRILATYASTSPWAGFRFSRSLRHPALLAGLLRGRLPWRGR
jgi:hypothetical protein